MSIPGETDVALAASRKAVSMGMPAFTCRLNVNGDPFPPRGWESVAADPDVLDKWSRGKALCGVTGTVYDVIDVDPRNGGKPSWDRLCADLGEDGPEIYWTVYTPSGGVHQYISPLGIGSRKGFLPGIDLKGGKPDGSSRGFVFLPPTVRPSKVTGELTAYWFKQGPRVANEGPCTRLIGLIAEYESARRPTNGDGGGRESLRKLFDDCVRAPNGLQQPSLLRYCHELERQSGDREYILDQLENVASVMKVYVKNWLWTRQELAKLLHAPGKVIPDAEPGELDGVDIDLRRPSVRLAPVPDYPVPPGVLGKLVSRAGHLPPALVGGAGLAALAAAAGSWSLVMPDGSAQYPALWIPLIAPRGAGKSPALDLAFEDLRELDANAWHAYRRELAEWSAMSKDERPGSKPSDPSVLLDDFTLEHLARVLAGGEERATVVSDELSGWLRGLGRYGRGGGAAEVGRILSLWSCSPWKYGRVVGETSLLIRTPVVSLVGGLQPHLHVLLGDDDTGMRPRWLPHYIPAWEASWGKMRAPSAWRGRISELYVGQGEQLVLEGKGLECWEENGKRWRNSARGAGISDTVHGALAKADVQCARIALVLAAAAGETGEISAGAVQAAADVIDYVIGVWEAMPSPEMFALSEKDRILGEKVARLRSWVEHRGGRATKREIQQGKVAGVISGADCDALVRAYDRTYPGRVVKEKTGKRGPATIVVLAPERGD